MKLTVILVEDAVDDRVAAAGQEDEYLRDGVAVDEDTTSCR